MYQKNLIGSVTRSAGVYKNDCLSPLFKAQFQKMNFVTEVMQLPLLPYKKAGDWFEIAQHFTDYLLAPRAVVLQQLAYCVSKKHSPYNNTAMDFYNQITANKLDRFIDTYYYASTDPTKLLIANLIFSLLKQNQVAYSGIYRGYVAYQAHGVCIPQANINTCSVHFDAHSYEPEETHERSKGFFKRQLW